jgi:phage shock protein A
MSTATAVSQIEEYRQEAEQAKKKGNFEFAFLLLDQIAVLEQEESL